MDDKRLEADLQRKRFMLSALAGHSQTVKNTSVMAILTESDNGFVSAELIVDSPRKALELLGFAFIRTARLSGIMEDEEIKQMSNIVSGALDRFRKE